MQLLVVVRSAMHVGEGESTLKHWESPLCPHKSEETMVQRDNVERRIRDSSCLSPIHVVVDDISGGCGTSFAIIVVSSSFEGVRLLERHRMIHKELGPEMSEIHALQLKCFTPEQYRVLEQNGTGKPSEVKMP